MTEIKVDGLVGHYAQTMALFDRLERERRTVDAMLRIYCRDHHRPQGRISLCSECRELGEYAHRRLDRCPYGDGKPTCAECPVHCYRHQQRDRIREVMRYAGPRMVWRHPLLAVMHLLDGRREVPELPGRSGSGG